MDQDSNLDARWQDSAGRYDHLAAVSAQALMGCVAEDLRLTEGTVFTDHIVEYRTARALQLLAERELIGLSKALGIDACEPLGGSGTRRARP